MKTFLRFHTSLRCGDTGRELGVFRAAGKVTDWPILDANARNELESVLAWFNEHLPAPPSDEITEHAQFWFHSTANEFVSHIWQLVWLLRHEGLIVSRTRTRYPGKIIYEDDFQVAAIR